MLAIASVVGIVIAIVIRVDRQRTQEIQSLSDKLNFAFTEDAGPALTATTQQFDLFSRGRDRKLRNIIQGRVKHLTVTVADYSYATGSRRNRNMHIQTVAIVQSNSSYFPKFVLTPKNTFHTIGGLFGLQDINFDAYPTFSNNYCLQAVDESALRDKFTSAGLLLLDAEEKISLEGNQQALLYYQNDKTLKPQQWRTFINSACHLHQQFQ